MPGQSVQPPLGCAAPAGVATYSSAANEPQMKSGPLQKRNRAATVLSGSCVRIGPTIELLARRSNIPDPLKTRLRAAATTNRLPSVRYRRNYSASEPVSAAQELALPVLSPEPAAPPLAPAA